MSRWSQHTVEAFILDYLSTESGRRDLTNTTDFVAESVLDSFGIINLIMDLECEFVIKFQVSDLADPAARTVHGLAHLVVRNLA